MAGCGGGGDGEDPASPNGRTADVRFAGGEFAGTLYLLASRRNELNADLYRLRGSFDRAERLTRDGRVSAVTAHGDTVVVSNARGSGSDRLEVANLDGGDALPGRLIDPAGQAPDFSPGGKLLYQVPQYTDAGGDAGVKHFVTTAEPGARRRLALRAKTSDTVGWGPGEELALVPEGSRRILLDPGGPKQRSLDTGFAPLRGGFFTSSRGEVLTFGPRGKVAIIRRDGSRQAIESRWDVVGCWSPDGTAVLAKLRDRIGLVAARDGTVSQLGRVIAGKVFGAAWVAGDASER